MAGKPQRTLQKSQIHNHIIKVINFSININQNRKRGERAVHK